MGKLIGGGGGGGFKASDLTTKGIIDNHGDDVKKRVSKPGSVAALSKGKDMAPSGNGTLAKLTGV